MLSEAKIMPRDNPLDTLCATLEEKMQYGPGERDMVMLQHKFDIELADGSKVVYFKKSLIAVRLIPWIARKFVPLPL